ncbi:MAG TPA: helix-turn-helix domain-containing protein, partial [Candidatus Syntrophosphaera thermopropionivorans]|nr:helix-turn-helix domain-containing protein [Candidatus Syntrophosphaera thermopropionivorans]
KAFRINPRTLFRWISQFKDQGVEGLVDKPKGRKPALLTDEMKRQLVQWIETKKDSDGKEVSWTLDKLRAELEKVYSVKISKPALSVNLAKMNIRISELFPRISRQTRENR